MRTKSNTLKKHLHEHIVHNQNGGIFVMTLLVMSILMILGFSLIMLLSSRNKTVINSKRSLKAHYLAEAGIEKVIVEYLLKDSNKDWSDNQFSEIYENEPFAGGNFSAASKKGSSNSIIISATGESNGITENINVLVAVEWLKQPPAITILQWQKQEIDSL